MIAVSRGFATFRRVAVAVDLVILTVRDDRLQVLLIERGVPPHLGGFALPGGFIEDTENTDAAARRELEEETGLGGEKLYLEQLRTYSTPDRDPRGRVVTVAYLAVAPNLPIPAAGTDARTAGWQPVSRITSGQLALAFDHAEILRDGVERARAKLEYTTLAAEFCGPEFTMSELRRVYEVVWGVEVDPRNFHRKVINAPGFLVPTGQKRAPETGRPAALYRRGSATVLYPPMLRANPDS
jgi:8-oxo-dGTP diphosphatase